MGINEEFQLPHFQDPKLLWLESLLYQGM